MRIYSLEFVTCNRYAHFIGIIICFLLVLRNAYLLILILNHVIVIRISSFLVKKKASKFFETLLFIFVKITHTKPQLLLVK